MQVLHRGFDFRGRIRAASCESEIAVHCPLLFLAVRTWKPQGFRHNFFGGFQFHASCFNSKQEMGIAG